MYRVLAIGIYCLSISAMACDGDEQDPVIIVLTGGAGSGGSGAIPASGGAGGRTSNPPVVDDDVPLEPPYMPPPGDDLARPTDEEPARCQADARGNWVCLWPVGPVGNAGPCAIGSDDTVTVANQVDATGSVRVRLARYRLMGEPLWSRQWLGIGGASATSLRINALVAAPDGTVHWGGEDCGHSAELPDALGAGYNGGSCLDARLVSLDAEGDVFSDWLFGTQGGLERITSLAQVPGESGLYISGSFGSPLIVPGHPEVRGPGGQDHFVLRRGEHGDVAWIRTWGTPQDDGNYPFLAASVQQDIAVSGSLGLSPGNGFVARLAGDGTLIWQRDDPDVYISRVAIAGDDQVYITPGMAQVTATDRSEVSVPGGYGIAHIAATAEQTLILASQRGSEIAEVDLAGNLQREHRFIAAESADQALGLWYTGGVCVGAGGVVGVSNTIASSSDFGILDEPIAIEQRSAYLLVLRDWGKPDRDAGADASMLR
jgi:hypothetical protein